MYSARGARKIKHIAQLMSIMRPRYLISRTWFELKRRAGIFQRLSPALPWAALDPLPASCESFTKKWRERAPALPIALQHRIYLAPHLEGFAVQLGHSPEAEAKAIAAGRFRTASNEFINLGMPPDWNRGQQDIAHLHWSKISAKVDATSQATAEVSQFSWAYTLVRAWILSGGDTYVETFWILLEDWLEKNLPNQGPQWVSDEVVARRVLAITYATQALRFHPGTTDERLSKVARLISASAKRLELTQGFTYTQSAIQGLTVSLALFTAGALWPQLHEADVWRSDGLERLINKGNKIMINAGRPAAQATSDSLRVLEIFTWAEIILRHENERESLPESLQKNIRLQIANLIHQPLKHRTSPPLFPLSGCLNSDALPALAVALTLFTGNRLPAGPQDETSLLLIGPLCASECTSQSAA